VKRVQLEEKWFNELTPAHTRTAQRVEQKRFLDCKIRKIMHMPDSQERVTAAQR
jgi:hypothetical protein